MSVLRVAIQRRELDLMIGTAADSAILRAAEALVFLLDGNTVIIEERIGVLPGDEELIEETILEAVQPQ